MKRLDFVGGVCDDAGLHKRLEALMRYQGGKSRIATKLANVIRKHCSEDEIYEPFCGGGAMTLALAKAGFKVHASDNHPDLILMWQALKTRESEPFRDVTEEEFKALKHAAPSARRGFVRFGGSFGGDFNAGFGRHHHGEGDPQRQYVWQDSQRNLAKFADVLPMITWSLRDYRDIPPEVPGYFDPPYAGVYAYQGRKFDHELFWNWVAGRKGASFTSELAAPNDLQVIWSKEHTTMMASNSPASVTAQAVTRIEKLFYKPAST